MYYIGIDLGGTNIAVGVCDESGNILYCTSAKTNAAQPFEGLVSDIANAVLLLLKAHSLTMSDIAAVGMGTPSCIDPKSGLLVNANNLGWRNVPLYDEMKKHFDVPVFIQNDAACAVLGEMKLGAAKGFENVLMVTLGTGVGGGIILYSRLWNGCDNMGAEIGHTKLVFGGRKCSCGQRGCLEQYASATALIRQYNEVSDEMVASAKEVFDRADSVEALAKKVVEQYISYLSAGLSTLIAVFRPQLILIGGGVSARGEKLLSPLREQLMQDTFSADLIGIPEIRAAALGNDAGIIGAAMLCRQEDFV